MPALLWVRCASALIAVNLLPPNALTKITAQLPIGRRTGLRDGVQNRRSARQETGGVMALTKRGKTWHTHFFVDGVRYRQSLGTTDWREAQAREKALIAQALQGKL